MRVQLDLLGTGYRVDVTKYSFITEQLPSRPRRTDRFPELQWTFESSVPGVYFAGAPAAWSFGPLMRLVAGAEFSARAISEDVRKRVPKSSAVSPGQSAANGK